MSSDYPTPTPSLYVAPIVAALKNIDFRLKRNPESRWVIAAPTVRELKKQKLPPHMRITPNKRQGQRVAVRGRRHYHEANQLLANWPQDALVESALFTLACVISGDADLRIADYILHCKTGDMVLFPPGTPRNNGSRGHFEENPEGRICELLWMDAQATGTDGLRCWICRSEGRKHWTGRELGSCWIPHRFSAQLYEGLCVEAHNGRHRDLTMPLFSNLIALLQDEIADGNVLDEWGRPGYSGKHGQSALIDEALAYIQGNLNLNLTINDVARHVAVSPATFTRHFKNQTGMTFQQYQTQLRLKLAEEMLVNSQIPIKLICDRIGLQYVRFWTIFHEKYGCSPSEYRSRKIEQK